MRLPEKATGAPLRLLVVTAVAAEAKAICEGLGAGDDRLTVIAGGVGPAAVSASTTRALVQAAERGTPYGVVISTGIAGGFAGRVDVGATVLGTAAVAADLGAETPDGFLSIAELDFGQSIMECDAEVLAALRQALPDAVVGAVLTVSTVTGTAERAAVLRRRHPDAVAEAMEGFGVATAAQQSGVAFAELRTISNPIGPRDRSAWRIADALAALARAGASLASLVP
jgi:futalosine hydrolase